MSQSMTRRVFGTAVGAAILTSTIWAPAFAATYPEREVTLIVQGSAGGGSDIIARTIANIIQKKKLSPTPIIVENRPGGGGAVGYTYVAKRQGDPYFIGTIGGSFFTTPLLGQSPVNYEAFTPIAAIAADPYVMAVSAKSGITSLDQVKALKTVRVGTTGVVTDPGIIAKMLEKSSASPSATYPLAATAKCWRLCSAAISTSSSEIPPKSSPRSRPGHWWHSRCRRRRGCRNCRTCRPSRNWARTSSSPSCAAW